MYAKARNITVRSNTVESDPPSSEETPPLPNNEEEEVERDVESDSPVPPPRTGKRRFSVGKIPLPHSFSIDEEGLTDDVETRTEMNEEGEVIEEPKVVRKQSVDLTLYKNFREENESKNTDINKQIVHVESKGRFRTMRKGLFQIERMLERERAEKEQKEREFVAPPRLLDTASAFHFQSSLFRLSTIIQGFLAGISLALAVFAFIFSSSNTLMDSYRFVSIPVQAFCMFAFTVGLASAVDRMGIYKTKHFLSLEQLVRACTNNSIFCSLIWLIGMSATMACVRFDQEMWYDEKEVDVHGTDVLIWKVSSVVRAVCASFGWLFQVFQKDNDEVAKSLKTVVLEDVKHWPETTLENVIQKSTMTLSALEMN